MQYLKPLNEVKSFEQWLDFNYLPPISQLIWYNLFILTCKNKWSDWISLSNFRLMKLLDLKNEKSFINFRKKLIQAGLLEYIRGKKGSPSKYRLFFLSTLKNEPISMEKANKNEISLKGSPVSRLLTYYQNLFLEQFGEKPLINFDKDEKILKELLNFYSEEKLKNLLEYFFKAKDAFILNSSYSLGIFKSQLNKLIIYSSHFRTKPMSLGMQSIYDFATREE